MYDADRYGRCWVRYGVCSCSHACSNTVSVIHRLKSSLSMNCLNNMASSFIMLVTIRVSTASCSIRALASSEFGWVHLGT